VKRTGSRLCAVLVFAFVLTSFFTIEAHAASGSCQSGAEGKLDCMEFTGNLPVELKLVCTMAGRARWIDSPCPQENVLGYCEVPRTDDIQQRSYCYRMAQLPDADRIEYCRMGCNGIFITSHGEASAPSPSAIAPSPSSAKLPDSAPVAANLQSNTPIESSRFTMEQNTNLFGEDYKDIDLDTPDPALCAEACMGEVRCKAWTYVKPGVQGDNAKCWLKDKVPHRSPDGNCVSGVKRN
jgi:hypothetical protein